MFNFYHLENNNGRFLNCLLSNYTEKFDFPINHKQTKVIIMSKFLDAPNLKKT